MMQQPAPYTPETIASIRAMAPLRSATEIASLLHWDVGRLQRVARDHSIEIRGAVVVAPSAAVVKSLTAKSSAAIAKHSKSETDERDQFLATLYPMQAAIFRVLMRDIGGEFIGAQEILDRSGKENAVSEVARAARIISVKLRGKPWRIDSQKGRGGGFRLLHVKQWEGKEPASVSEGSLSNTMQKQA